MTVVVAGVVYKVGAKPPRSGRWRLLAVAALVLLLTGAGVWFYLQQQPKAYESARPLLNELEAETGCESTKRKALPDPPREVGRCDPYLVVVYLEGDVPEEDLTRPWSGWKLFGPNWWIMAIHPDEETGEISLDEERDLLEEAQAFLKGDLDPPGADTPTSRR